MSKVYPFRHSVFWRERKGGEAVETIQQAQEKQPLSQTDLPETPVSETPPQEQADCGQETPDCAPEAPSLAEVLPAPQLPQTETEPEESENPASAPPLADDLPVPQPSQTEAEPEESEDPESAPPKSRKVRPEAIMGIVAGVAALLLIVLVVLCLPHFSVDDEDPESLPDFHQEAQEPEPTQEETQIVETEPENPTIPPDPNPYSRYDFQYNSDNYLVLQNVTSYPGVDVSAHQGSINWKSVKASGIDFAMIRLGYRGYGSGKLVEDEYAQQNLTGATEAGLRIGAYFFSQALNIAEADEEIAFMLEVLGEYKLEMPIILDWEIPADDARTAGKMDARTLTDIQLHFCSVMEEKGYTPMVYFNWHQSENLYYLSELEEYPFWLALYQDRMTYPWKVEMWQYSDKGSVPGINGPVDLNVYMPY